MAALGQFASVVLIAVAVPLCAQPPESASQTAAQLEPPRELVRDVIYNELHDREHDSHWEYRSTCSSPAANLVREQVETTNGPVFHVIEHDGSPLDEDQRRREDQRLAEYIHNPAQVAHVERAHEEDETRLASVMELLPQAFLFTYEPGSTDNTARLAFRPDPSFVPSGYEARIVHALTGTLTIDTRLKRMIEMRGVLAERVDFGYGVLGHVEKGGSFEIHRRQVSTLHWKTDMVSVHIQGKVLMLKTVSKDEVEERSDFQPVPQDTTLAEAEQMLNESAASTDRAQLTPAAARQK